MDEIQKDRHKGRIRERDNDTETLESKLAKEVPSGRTTAESIETSLS